MNAQPSLVMQDIETLGARSAHIEMKHKLIDLVSQKIEAPASAADLLYLCCRKLLSRILFISQSVTIRVYLLRLRDKINLAGLHILNDPTPFAIL